MPYIHVQTNAAVSKEQADAIKAACGQAITLVPGKSEAWLMVGVEGGRTLYFKGTDAPAAMVAVELLGGADSAVLSRMTGALCEALADTLSLPPDRVYVRYLSTADWGWNGSNF